MIIVAGYALVEPSAIANLRTRIHEEEKYTRTEKGCIYMAIAIDDEQTGHVTILEKWDDEESLYTHLKTARSQAFVAELTKVGGEVELKVYDATGERDLALA